MKRTTLFLLALLAFGLAQAQEKIEGKWEGNLAVGNNSIRLVFHLKKDSVGFSGLMDSPDQGAKNIPLSKVEVRNDSLVMEIAAIGGKASGRFTNDSTFSGKWSQGMSFPLNLKKSTSTAHSIANRPQTPRPPFPYQSQDVVYFNHDKSIQFGATLTFPNGEGPFSAVILITGSGLQNRDEELLEHKPFAVIADYLTKLGFVVLRVDDRGTGQTGDVQSATSRDFANDVNVGLDYLKERMEVAKDKIGMLGHSEGGMIAQIVAAERPDISFVVSLAGPGQKITELLEAQNKAIMVASGLPIEMVEDYLKLYRRLVPVISTEPSDSIAKVKATAIFSQWMKTTPRETVARTTGVADEENIPGFINRFTQQLRTPWFSYFLKYDPAPYIKKMKAMVLALNGDKDIQVISKPNLDAWQAALAKSSVKKYDTIELKGLNHLFQRCITCILLEYGKLEETIAPEALEAIGTWLKENVR